MQPLPPLNRRAFVLASSTALVALRSAGAKEPAAAGVVGPLLGHVDATSACVWARLPAAGACTAELFAPSRNEAVLERREAVASAATDGTAQWRFTNLAPGTRYGVRLLAATQPGMAAAPAMFRTAPAPDQPAHVSLALGSCAHEDEKSRAVWRRMLAEKVDGLILCGDTPYIDSTDLARQRLRYREFNRVPEFQELTRQVPCWGTWDDHDFGQNDSDGRLPGKQNARRAFTEYRCLAGYGESNQGVYTSFRYGPVEVFLIDARWFANTQPSPVDAKRPTLLGPAQWQWLTEGLKQSSAPWKLLVSGMIWDAKPNAEKDHWETYAHERRALFQFIRERKIAGVVLFGGDVHCSRVLRYAPEATVGYPLYQFISSPIHDRVLPALNHAHPNLVHSAATPNTFLKLTFDTTTAPRLTARFLDKDGRLLFDEVAVNLADATPRA